MGFSLLSWSLNLSGCLKHSLFVYGVYPYSFLKKEQRPLY